MKFAMASYGTRGDVEPSVAVARELRRRGHEVHMAVPPDLVAFAEAAGLAALPYGREMEPQLDDFRDLWTNWARHFWRVQDLVALCRQGLDNANTQWAAVGDTLITLAEGADLLSSGVGFEQPAANVAEFYGMPMVALHTMPWRPNGQLFPSVPSVLTRNGMYVYDWLAWRFTKRADDRQRKRLGLPRATAPTPRRMAEHGWLEIQAYDSASIQGLAQEWSRCAGRRPFVGPLTMGLSTEVDDEVASWMAAGTPPICFAFGSIPVKSPADAIAMIGAACAQLGERALLCAGGTDCSAVPLPDHVKVVGAANYSAIFPSSRAIVHHGGSGTTAASLRAGVPTLVLWTVGDQPLWGNQLVRLKVGASRRFSTATQESLVRDLRRILAPDYALRAKEIATLMTPPTESIERAADLMESAAHEHAGRRAPSRAAQRTSR